MVKQLTLKKSGVDYSEIAINSKKFSPFLKFEENIPKNVVFLEYKGQSNHFFGYSKEQQVLMHDFVVLDVSEQTEKSFSTQSKRFMLELKKQEPILNKELWVIKTGKSYDTQYKISENKDEILFAGMSVNDKVKWVSNKAKKTTEEIYDLMNIQIDELSGLIDEDGAITLVRKNLGL